MTRCLRALMRSNVAIFTGSSGLGGFDSEYDHSTPLCPGGGVDPAGQRCETCAYCSRTLMQRVAGWNRFEGAESSIPTALERVNVARRRTFPIQLRARPAQSFPISLKLQYR